MAEVFTGLDQNLQDSETRLTSMLKSLPHISLSPVIYEPCPQQETSPTLTEVDSTPCDTMGNGLLQKLEPPLGTPETSTLETALLVLDIIAMYLSS